MSAAHAATQALGPRASAGAGAGRPPGTLSGACSDSGASCRKPRGREPEVGAGCGHAVATQTPRSWEVQAGAARPLLSGCARLRLVTAAAAAEKHQPFPGPCTRARSVRSCMYCFLWKDPIPGLPSAFPLERSTGASCLLLSPPDHPHPHPPTCVQSRLHSGREAVGPGQPQRRARRDCLWF